MDFGNLLQNYRSTDTILNTAIHQMHCFLYILQIKVV